MTNITIILMFLMAFGVAVVLTVLVFAIFRNAHEAEKKAERAAQRTTPPASSEDAGTLSDQESSRRSE